MPQLSEREGLTGVQPQKAQVKNDEKEMPNCGQNCGKELTELLRLDGSRSGKTALDALWGQKQTGDRAQQLTPRSLLEKL